MSVTRFTRSGEAGARKTVRVRFSASDFTHQKLFRWFSAWAADQHTAASPSHRKLDVSRLAIVHHNLGHRLLAKRYVVGTGRQAAKFEDCPVLVVRTVFEGEADAAQSIVEDSSRVDLAKVYLKENRLDGAREHLERARAIDPKDKTAYSQLAVVYRRTGKLELANAMLITLNKLNEEDRQQDHRQRLPGRRGESVLRTGGPGIAVQGTAPP